MQAETSLFPILAANLLVAPVLESSNSAAILRFCAPYAPTRFARQNREGKGRQRGLQTRAEAITLR
jgi:hypothetical protein